MTVDSDRANIPSNGDETPAGDAERQQGRSFPDVLITAIHDWSTTWRLLVVLTVPLVLVLAALLAADIEPRDTWQNLLTLVRLLTPSA